MCLSLDRGSTTPLPKTSITGQEKASTNLRNQNLIFRYRPRDLQVGKGRGHSPRGITALRFKPATAQGKPLGQTQNIKATISQAAT